MAFGLGLEFVFPIIALVYAGRWADARLGTQPLLLLAGTFGGFAIGLYQLIRKTRIKKKDP